MISTWSHALVLPCIMIGLFGGAKSSPTGIFGPPFPINIPNQPGFSGCSVYVYGEQGGRDVFLNQNSQYQAVDAAGGAPQPEPLFAHMQGTPIFLPPGDIASGRIYVVCGGQFAFNKVIDANGKSKIQANPDPATTYNFMEFTLTSGRIFVDITMVDFLADPPLGYQLEGGRTMKKILGPRPDAVNSVCNDLKAQSQVDGMPWGQLCVESGGKIIRVLSPGEYMKTHPDAFADYFTAHVKAVYTQWASQPRVFDLGNSGKITCTGSADGMSANCNGQVLALPTAGDVFGCASGPFAATGQTGPFEALRAPLCALFNRGTALSEANPGPVRNWYANKVHEYVWAHIGYAFPFDDVRENGVAVDSTLSSDAATGLTINVGGTWPTE